MQQNILNNVFSKKQYKKYFVLLIQQKLHGRPN